MRSHTEIIKAAGGPAKIADALGLAGRKRMRVYQWETSDSIPGKYWAQLARAGITSLEELSSWAERDVRLSEACA